MFIGREKELKSLNNLYASDKFEFYSEEIIYGTGIQTTNDFGRNGFAFILTFEGNVV